MNQQKYQIPSSYEAAVARKEAVLEMINQYNEALFNQQPLPYSDEEIDALQEEYQILNDQLRLTKKEKLQQLAKEDLEEVSEGVYEKKTTFADKVHPFVYIYSAISTLLVSGVFNKVFGDLLYRGVAEGILFKSMYKSGEHRFIMDSVSKVGYWFIYVVPYLLIPLCLVLLTMGVYFIFKKRNVENRKVMFIVLMVQIGLFVVSNVLLYCIFLHPELATNYDQDAFTWKYIEWLAGVDYDEAMRALGACFPG